MSPNQKFKIVAIVGMPGSGKSAVSKVFERQGYRKVRFGDVTDEEVKKQGLELNEENERRVREELRKQHGMAAYAIMNLPRISDALQASNVVIDGLYSWEEHKFLKEEFDGAFSTVAVWAPPRVRYQRLKNRTVRRLTPDESKARDFAEIENVNKGGPIAMADYTILNDSTLESLISQVMGVIRALK